MTASDLTDPKDNRPRLRHIRTVCRELIERKASAMGLTHDEFTDGYGLLPDMFLRAILAGLGGGTHRVTVHLEHEEDSALFALLMTNEEKTVGELSEMGYLAIASRATEDGGVITARTKNPEGSDLFRAWALVDGRPEPLAWSEAFEVATAYESSKAADFDYADAFEPERFLRRVVS